MRTQKLPVALIVVLGIVMAAVVSAGGPILWVIAVMGLPFIALFLVLGGVAHSHADNGHFRRPEQKG